MILVKTLCEDSPSYSSVKISSTAMRTMMMISNWVPKKSATTDHQTEAIHHIVINDRRVLQSNILQITWVSVLAVFMLL